METKQISKTKKEITRQCAVCGKDILVRVFPGGKYTGGNYFHSIAECSPNGHCPNLYTKSTSTPRNSALNEYWECDKCYNDWEN